jgi:parallel beta-helix repeat protein
MSISRGFRNLNSFGNLNFRDSNNTISKLIPIAAVCLGVAIAAENPLTVSAEPVSAENIQSVKMSQAQAQSDPQKADTQKTEPQTVIYVDPRNGSDRAGNHPQAVLKTITQAIKLSAGGNAIIQLARGTYSAASGEIFPLELPPNVVLRGDEASKGKEIVIVGGGNFNSALFSSQNVTIVAGDRAELRGVTITNPNARGYGLWIESSSPVVANNTLVGSQRDGAFVSGNSSALISSNVFRKNGGTGISIFSGANPEIRGNSIQDNEFGLNIQQDATPQITENLISENKDGIIAQGNARPVLRGNAIERSQRGGLSILAKALPDLGGAQDLGGNIFRDNRQFDIKNSTDQAIASIGNQLDVNKAIGKLQFPDGQTGQTASTSIPPTQPKVTLTLKPPKSRPSTDLVASLNTNTNVIANPNPNTLTGLTPSSLPRPIPSNPYNPSQIPTTKTLAPNQITPSDSIYSRTIRPVSVPSLSSIPSNALSNSLNNSLDNSQLRLPQSFDPTGNSVVVRISPNQFTSSIPANTTIHRDLPPIRLSPPAGEPVNRPIIIAPLSPTTFGAPRLTSSDRPKFRVVIPISSKEDTLQIRRLVPNAFASSLNGRLVVQVGAYNDRKIANVQVQNLAQSGFVAVIEAINP